MRHDIFQQTIIFPICHQKLFTADQRFPSMSFCRKALLFRRHFVQKKLTWQTQHVSFEKSTCIILLHKITTPLQLEISHLFKYIIKKTVSSSKYLKYSRKTNSGKLLQGKSLMNIEKELLV